MLQILILDTGAGLENRLLHHDAILSAAPRTFQQFAHSRRRLEMAEKSKSQSTPKKAKIFIVDDHPVFREGLVKVILEEEDLIVCGEAGMSAEAFAKIGRLKPDLV